jgi:cholesterol oxidase
MGLLGVPSFGRLLGSLVRRPFATLALLFKRRWAERSIGLVGMQRAEGVLRFRRGRGLFTLFGRGLVSETVPDRPCRVRYRKCALSRDTWRETTDGIEQRMIPAAFGLTTTVHIFGGCIIGRGPEDGVVDVDQRVFGYQNLFICDGSVIPTNPGTTPTLTIAALAERCMAKIPSRQAG